MSIVSAQLERLVKPRPRRFRYDEYRRMVDEGFFESDKVELFDGEVLTMSALSEPHNITVLLARQHLERAFGPGFVVRPQMPLAFEPLDSSPEPDIAVVQGSPRDFRTPPATAALIVEVAVTSLEFDLGAKAVLYASAGIADYWVIDVLQRQVIVHRNPIDRRYTSINTLPSSAPIQPLGSGQAIVIRDLLP